MDTQQAKRLKELEKKNERLRENGYYESFNSRMRDEFLNGEIFGSLREAEVLTIHWVDYYNNIRPHSSLRGRAPQTIIPA